MFDNGTIIELMPQILDKNICVVTRTSGPAEGIEGGSIVGGLRDVVSGGAGAECP